MDDEAQASREMYLGEFVATLPQMHYARRTYNRLIGAARDVIDAQANRPRRWWLPFIARPHDAIEALRQAVEAAER